MGAFNTYVGGTSFGPCTHGPLAQVVPYQPVPHPDWVKFQQMASDPHGYRIAQLEAQVAQLKARIAALEAEKPYHGEWPAG